MKKILLIILYGTLAFIGISIGAFILVGIAWLAKIVSPYWGLLYISTVILPIIYLFGYIIYYSKD